MQSTSVIAVQAFAKPDTLMLTLDSLLKCEGIERYALLIYQDHWHGPRRTAKYEELHGQVAESIAQWADSNRKKFASFTLHQAAKNRGTCGTAKDMVDLALATSPSVLFSEDDVVFEHDALLWFEAMRQSPAFESSDTWAIAGESKFFDSKALQPSSEDVAEAIECVNLRQLDRKFVLFDFLPSSCFFTSRSKWSEFGATRGTPNGDRDVNNRCKAEGKKCIWPVVARSRDVGMHHPLGYSVQLKGVAQVGAKNSYVTSGMLQKSCGEWRELKEGTGDIFRKFTQRWRPPAIR